MFSSDFEDLREVDKKEFTRLVNKLLSQCFVSKRNNRKDYNFLQRHKKLFNEYFSYTGFQLDESDEFGVFHLINTQGLNRKLFNLNETIILLIIRILYEEKKRELSLTKDVVITPAEIQDHYMTVRNGKNITKTELSNALATFRRFNIINYGRSEFDTAFDLSLEETPILVYDTILMAVPLQNIKEVHENLDKFRTKSLLEEEN